MKKGWAWAWPFFPIVELLSLPKIIQQWKKKTRAVILVRVFSPSPLILNIESWSRWAKKTRTSARVWAFLAISTNSQHQELVRMVEKTRAKLEQKLRFFFFSSWGCLGKFKLQLNFFGQKKAKVKIGHEILHG